MPDFDKLVVITKKTRLQELQERYSTVEQAEFLMEARAKQYAVRARMAEGKPAAPPEAAPDVALEEYQIAHDTYMRALNALKAALPEEPRAQFVDREFLPNFIFGPDDLILTVGPDGLVVNTAKYLSSQPILALNPDPHRIDGILVPFRIDEVARALHGALRGSMGVRQVSMAQAELDDGQTLYGVNDLFIGQRSHVSARYRMRYRGREESQSSSGIIISTGAGSTGWFRSIITGAAGVMQAFAPDADFLRAARQQYRFDWGADYIFYSVREPFVSNVSSADLVFGRIEAGEWLELVSQMPQDGVIFSDGIEADNLEFNSGAIARIGLADRKVRLLVSEQAGEVRG